jgi:hypothetical protein
MQWWLLWRSVVVSAVGPSCVVIVLGQRLWIIRQLILRRLLLLLFNLWKRGLAEPDHHSRSFSSLLVWRLFFGQLRLLDDQQLGRRVFFGQLWRRIERRKLRKLQKEQLLVRPVVFQ